MKKSIIIMGFCLASSSIFAQNLTDGLRYSMEGLNGTSRFNAMSGAFSSLGGDLSAVALNPAGSSIFTRSEMNLTMGGVTNKNITTFQGNQQETITSDFLFSQFGVAFPIAIESEGWKNIAFAFNYQKTNNFDANDLVYNQQTTGANLSDFFLDKANGIMQQDLMLEVYENKQRIGRESLSNLYSRMGKLAASGKFRNALLGYTTGLVKPLSGKTAINPTMTNAEADAILQENEYKKNITNGTTTYQHMEQYTEGGVNKYNFNFAGRYDFLSFGINLNSHSVDYRVVHRHQEDYPNNTESNIRSAIFENELRTIGSGFSLQIGAIAEVATGLRIGLTYASPTWYSLHDETTQSLSVKTSDRGTFFANPDVINLYEKYNFRTPGSWTVGASWVWNKQLILSADYMYRGYKYMRFTSDNQNSENTIIQNTLGDTNTLRFGAEYRLPLSKTNHLFFRGGYRYEQSPYRTELKPIGDLTGFSTGLGLSFGSMRFDLSYDRATRAYQPQIYESILTDTPQVDNTLHNILLSFSLKL